MTTHRVFAFSIAVSLLAALPSPAQESVIHFSDSFFDTSSSSQSAWLLSGLDVPNSRPSCLTLPSTDPEGQTPGAANLCSGSTDSSYDGDGRSLRGDFDIFRTPYRGVVGSVAVTAPYDPSIGGLLRGVRIRFKFLHGGENSGTPANALVSRALLLQQDPDGTARFFVSTASKSSVSNATAYSTFDMVLTEQDFLELVGPSFAQVDEASNPDFATGGPIAFGFAVDVGWDLWLGGPPGIPFTVRAYFVDAFAFELDSDFDGVADFQDNCTLDANLAQVDIDFDGFGDACDADCTQDGLTGAADFFALSRCSRQPDCDCDLNADGVTNVSDLLLMSRRWGLPVGPSGMVPQP